MSVPDLLSTVKTAHAQYRARLAYKDFDGARQALQIASDVLQQADDEDPQHMASAWDSLPASATSLLSFYDQQLNGKATPWTR